MASCTHYPQHRLERTCMTSGMTGTPMALTQGMVGVPSVTLQSMASWMVVSFRPDCGAVKGTGEEGSKNRY